MKFRASVIFTLLCFVAVTGTVAAQETTRGSMVVVVQDATGAVIPGAAVKIEASVQPQINGTTGSRGEVLFSNLIPGSYDVTVTSQGFKTSRVEGVGLRLSERRTVTVTMEPGDVVQVVEVIGGAGGIDLSTTDTGGHIEDIIYATVPVQRGITSAFFLAPGVSDGGGTCGQVNQSDGCANPSIGGASGFENLYLIDGVNVTHGGFGGFGTVSRVYGSLGSGTTTSFIKEVEIKTGGYDAKFGMALGGIVNVITKSGGSELHGAVFGYFSPDELEADRKIANDGRTTNFQRFDLHHNTGIDYGAEIGGAILKERLFFFGSINPSTTRYERSAPSGPQWDDVFTFGAGDCNAATNPSQPEAGCSDFGLHTIRERTINYAFKLTGQLGQNHRIESSLFGDPTIREFGPNLRMTGGLDPIARVPTDFSRLDLSNLNFALRYNGVMNPSWLINAHFGNNHNRFEEQQLFNAYSVDDRTVPGQRTQFGGVGFFENSISDAKIFSVDNTNIIDAGFLGTHEFTQGFYFDTNHFTGERLRTGPQFPVVSDPLLVAAGDVGQNTFGGSFRLFSCMDVTSTPDCFGAAPAAFQGASDTFVARQTRGSFEGADFNTIGRYTAAYAQDNWKLNDYLTIKLGLRWEQERLIGTQGTAYTYSNSWGPRAGVILDPFGTRKTKISFNFARFFQRLPNDLTLRVMSGERSYLNLHYWVDPSKNVLPDQSHYIGLTACPLDTTGDGNADSSSTGYVCVPITGPVTGGSGGRAFVSGNISGSSGVPPEPGTKMTYQDELGIGVQHEVGDSGIVLGVRYIDRRLKRITEDSNAVSIEQANAGLFNIPFILINPSVNADFFINPVLLSDPGSIIGQAVGTTPPSGTCFGGTLVSSEGTDAMGAPSGLIASAQCFTATSGDVGPDGIADGLPQPTRNYQAVEITFERRMRDNWQFFANWRIASLRGNFEGAFRNDNGQTDPGITSLFDFIDSPGALDLYKVGPLPNDRQHVVNAYGSYMFNQGAANGLNIGMGMRLSGGKPLTELLAHPLFDNAGEIPCNASALSVTDSNGATIYSTQCLSNGRGQFGRTPVFGTVDLHLDYPVRISESFRLRAGVDVFNTFNATRLVSTREFRESSAGVLDPDYNTGSTFQRPYNMRFSLRLEW